ncbi:MAG: AI-2E family transporter [Caldilineaceae bacterium]|nr:AI-2E family transporter [Caldilineaceae bacterium]
MRELTISPKSAFVTTFVVVIALITLYIAYLLGEILFILFGAIIFSSAIHPIVNQMTKRGINCSAAILLTYIVIISSVIGLLIVSVPPMVSLLSQVMEKDFLTSQLSSIIFDLRLKIIEWGQFRNLLPMVRVTPEMVETITTTSDEVGKQAWPVTQQLVAFLGKIGLLLVLAFYWLIARTESLELFLKLTPSEHRLQLRVLWNDIETRLGAYLRGQIILMLIVGSLSFVGLLVLQVPNALALAVIAGLTEAIPLVGPLLGAIPAILIGLLISPATALLVALLYTIIQILENNILVPKIMSANVGLNPLVVIIAIIAGSTLNGIVGALFAIPIAGAIQVVAQHMWLGTVDEVAANGVDEEKLAVAIHPELDSICKDESPFTDEVLIAQA